MPTKKETTKETVNELQEEVKKDHIAIIVLALVVLVLGVGILWLWNNKADSKLGSGDSEAISVVSKLSEILLIESNDPAEIREVKNVEELKSNDFFKNAEEGDYLIIFQNRIVLFRQSEELIINIAPYYGGDDFISVE